MSKFPAWQHQCLSREGRGHAVLVGRGVALCGQVPAPGKEWLDAPRLNCKKCLNKLPIFKYKCCPVFRRNLELDHWDVVIHLACDSFSQDAAHCSINHATKEEAERAALLWISKRGRLKA